MQQLSLTLPPVSVLPLAAEQWKEFALICKSRLTELQLLSAQEEFSALALSRGWGAPVPEAP
jgi:hypothetical protein